MEQTNTLNPSESDSADSEIIHRPGNIDKSGNIHKSRIPNQVPFISEDLSTHSINSVSSYPSILALKLSFTNHASNDAISILNPTTDPHTSTNTICNNSNNDNIEHVNSLNNDKIAHLIINTNDTLENKQQSSPGETSSDSSFYNNENTLIVDSDDDKSSNNNNKKKIKKILTHSHIKRDKKLNGKSQSHISHKININGMTMSLEKGTMSTKSSNIDDRKSENAAKKENNLILKLTTNDSGITRSIISPKNMNGRLLSATDVSSLLDHEDHYDPPQPSLHLSTVSTPTAIHTQYGSTRKSKSATPKDGDIITGISAGSDVSNAPNQSPHNIKITKVPRNSQYAPYATMLQSVVEEVSDQSSLENSIKNITPLPIKDASIEYHAYKRRQEEFNKIINNNRKQIKHNTNSMNMSLNINVINTDKTSSDDKRKSKKIKKKKECII